jgi:hypothetical protein
VVHATGHLFTTLKKKILNHDFPKYSQEEKCVPASGLNLSDVQGKGEGVMWQ